MDDRSRQERSATMRAVKAEGTSIERIFIDLMESKNVAGVESYPKDIVGKPDLIHRNSKIAIFIDGCFWHGCSKHMRLPRSNRDYWKRKVTGNRFRDKKNNGILRDSGWLVIRIWEHSFKHSRLLNWWATRIKNHITCRTPPPSTQSESP
jgi:DNA mismatch endonuclease, patch repair protein